MRFFQKLKWLQATVIIIAITVAIWCGAHYARRALVVFPYDPKNQDKSILALPTALNYQLGSWRIVKPKRSTAFIYFPKEKSRADTVRIGVFGDSHSWGYEVEGDNDYPFHLQRLLHENGYRHTEVLNFAFSNWGFHQSYLLWDKLGRDYNLDYILLGPACFQPQRDSSFQADDNILSLYSRYILDGDGTRLISIKGDPQSLVDRFRVYNSFIPPLDYLRYDRRTPAFWRYLMLPGMKMRNPFYYWRGAISDEIFEINRRLLKQMVDTSKSQILLLHRYSEVIQQFSPLKDKIYMSEIPHFSEEFPYWMLDHASSIGNYHMAQLFFHALKGDTNFSIRVMDLEDKIPEQRILANSENRDFLEISALDFILENKIMGTFYWNDSAAEGMNNKLLPNPNIHSLIGLKRKGSPFTKAVFLPLPFVAEPGVRLILRGRRSGKIIELGEVKWLRPGLPIGFIDLPEAMEGANLTVPPFIKVLNLVNYKKQLPAIDLADDTGGDFYLGEQRLSSQWDKPTQTLFLAPDKQNLQWVARATRSEFVNFDKIPDHGWVDLRVKYKNGSEENITVEAWRIRQQAYNLPAHGAGFPKKLK